MIIKVALARSGNKWQVYGNSSESVDDMTENLREDSNWIGDRRELSIIEVDLPSSPQGYFRSSDRILHDILLEKLNVGTVKYKLVRPGRYEYSTRYSLVKLSNSFFRRDKKVATVGWINAEIYVADKAIAEELAELVGDDFCVTLTI